MGHYDDLDEPKPKKKVNKGGRPPTKLNAEEIAQVEALGAVLSIEQIADYFGIAKSTFYSIMERQPEVSIRYKKGKAKAIGSVSQGLLKKAMSGDVASTIFYLKTQAGWKETQKVEAKMTVSDDGEFDW